MMKKIILIGLFCWVSGLIIAQNTYPKPHDIAPRLFYIQRTGSPNTIVYDANTDGSGQFKKDNPINIYWIKYSDNSRIEGLNYLQRTLAYGLKIAPEGAGNEYVFHFVSYSKRYFHLKKNAAGRPVVALYINGREAYLKRIFIDLEPALFGIKPNIHFVEIFGVYAHSGAPAYEKFVP